MINVVRRLKIKHWLWIGFTLALAIALGAPFLDADVFRPAIQRALERGLGRKVDVGKVYFNLLTGPGFTIDDVTIHEDPRAGIEPFIYVGELEARVSLMPLFSRHLVFSSLRLHEGPAGAATSINLVKTEAGPWNFQYWLNSAPAISGAMPSIKIRTGRVNFKFGDTKSVFYFGDADLEVAPSADRSVYLRFSGAPSRTDRAAQNFGHFFLRGNWSAQNLDLKVELERSDLSEVSYLMSRRDLGVHGIVAFNAQVSGPPSHLNVDGQLQVDDIHRWDLLPKRGGGWRIPYKGTLDLRGERIELASAFDANSPLSVQVRAWDFLSTPHWDASAELKQAPIATLLEVARHMGTSVPDQLVADGSLSGSIRYDEADGFNGQVGLEQASLTLPEGQPLHAANAALSIDHNSVSLDRSTITIGPNDSAEVEGSFNSTDGLDLKIVTRSLNVADLRSFGLSAIPLLELTPQGTLRGWTGYSWAPGEPGHWSGEYDLQNARFAIDGFADPLRVQSASVVSKGPRIALSKIHAKLGAIAFTGDYRYEPLTTRPHKFHVAIPNAEAAELERLFAPALIRERGFIARTLGLSAPPIPDWLKNRRADGTISIDSLTAPDVDANIANARLLWDGPLIRLVRLDAKLDPASYHGDLAIDLTGRDPHFRFDGKLADVPYKAGRVDFEGTLDTDGSGAALLANARSEGCFHARSISFAPDVDFRAAKGCYEMNSSATGARWKFPGIEVTQGPDVLYGTGASQPDGRIVLDLTNRASRPVHLTTTTPPASPQ